ncbi:MAG: HD domain-containing protein [Chloroflexi bacterium]|nr:HD domain-containing protein [Chloroflexota bacterium]
MVKVVARVPAADREAITKAFPLIQKIVDAKLREGVIKAWYMAWKESSFKKLEDAPFGLDPAPGETLVKHTNAVTGASCGMGDQLMQVYGVKVNMDYVLTGAILHDLDKIVMYDRRDGKIVMSELGQKIFHGAYAAHIALLVGLPQDIVFILMAHSGTVNSILRSPEARLITCVDIGMIRALQAATGTLPESFSH